MSSGTVSTLEMQTMLEVKELEIQDLRNEIFSLKNVISSKNRENGELKTSLKAQQARLSSLQRLSESYSNQVRNILSTGQQEQQSSGLVTPAPTEASDTSSDKSLSSPLFLPRAAIIPHPESFDFQLPPQSSSSGQLSFQSSTLSKHLPQTPVDLHLQLLHSSKVRKVCPLGSSSQPKSSSPTPRQLAAPSQPSVWKQTCPICSKQFTNLNLHVTLKHLKKLPTPVLTYKCPLCKRVMKKENQGRHMKKVHRKEISKDEYEVELVISARKEEGKMMYQVRWVLGDTSWEPEENLANCQDKITDYWKQQKIVGNIPPSTSTKKGGRKIQLYVRCLERNTRGRRVSNVKMVISETSSVRRVKIKYGKVLGEGVNIDQLQLFGKGKLLEDDQMVMGLEGEVLTAKRLGWG